MKRTLKRDDGIEVEVEVLDDGDVWVAVADRPQSGKRIALHRVSEQSVAEVVGHVAKTEKNRLAATAKAEQIVKGLT